MNNCEEKIPTASSTPTPVVQDTRCYTIEDLMATPLWPNSSKILQRTYNPLYINSDSFPIGKTAAVCF